MLDSRTFRDHDFMTIDGTTMTVDYLRTIGFTRPLLVRRDQDGSTKGLGMVMPPTSFSVDDVKDAVGDRHKVGVIDVATQSEAQDWTLGQWAEYFKTEPKDRIRNVISLEVSDTVLAGQIQVPQVVR